MDQKSDRLYPSAPLENIDFGKKIEKKINDVNSFNTHINNIKAIITFSKIKTSNQKRNTKFIRL